MRPIGLRLFAGQSRQAQEGFAARRTQAAYDPAQLHDRTGVAAPAQHFVKPRRAQPRVLRERVAQEGQIRIEHGHARRSATAPMVEAFGFQRAPHGVGMQLELVGDGADLPVFSEIESANVRQQCE